MDVTKLTIKNILKSLQQKEYSVAELTDSYLQRIKKYDVKIKAFLKVIEKEAREKSEKLDSQGKFQNLCGLPIAFKDNFSTQNLETTAGSHILKDYLPPYNATAIQKMLDAEAVILGKTNLDAFAHGSSTENSDYQITHNPWDLNRVPGGSSGGSAASIAASFCPLSFGTDTGGSIRQPAGFCNVTGLKPTYGLISRYGVIAMASSTDTVGFFTKSAEDTAFVLPYLLGSDYYDANVQNIKLDHSELYLHQGVKGLKIGLPQEFFVEGLDPRIKDLIIKSVYAFEKEGAEILEVSLPHSKYGIPVYYIQVSAEIASNLARHDGIRFPFSAMNDSQIKIENFEDIYFKTKTLGFGDEAKRRIMLGTYVLSSGYYDAYYEKARQVRMKIQEDFEKVFQKVDLLLTPSSPTLPFKIGEHSTSPLEMYLSDIFTVTPSLARIPGLTIPTGFIDNLPVGMQLLGPHFSENLLLRSAICYQKITNYHLQTPKLD